MSEILFYVKIRLEIFDSNLASTLDLAEHRFNTKNRKPRSPSLPSTNHKDAIIKKCVGNRKASEIIIETYEAEMRDEEKREFSFGNPSVQLTHGILHIYKDVALHNLATIDSSCLCMLAVPTNFAIHDLLKFISPFAHRISSLKVVSDSTPNHYTVLLNFDSPASAKDFYAVFNGTPFTLCPISLSREVPYCQMMFVKEVSIFSSSEGAALPIPGAIELPKCIVCMEKMDESMEGILTVLCNHSFHVDCLAQWVDVTCPVCRYSVTPPYHQQTQCEECQCQENLWMCLICGNIACGRYNQGHAKQHFESTQHTYVFDISTNRVWDYAGDNYVHRLIQSKVDGDKMVELKEGAGGSGYEDKFESISLECTYLLSKQLQTQREFFSARIEELEETFSAEVQRIQAKHEIAFNDLDDCKAKFAVVSKERAALEKKQTALANKYKKCLAELKDEREVSACLLKNQAELKSVHQESLSQKNKEIADLEENLRDLMFHLQAESTLAGCSDEDLKNAKISLPSAPPPDEAKPTSSSRSSRRSTANKHK